MVLSDPETLLKICCFSFILFKMGIIMVPGKGNVKKPKKELRDTLNST